MKNIAQYFVDRPIMAAVLSLLFLITGAIAVFQLPISEYPEVVPPTVVVRATYPGENQEVIAQTVATPLEQQINGVEGMLYSSSQATSDGVMTLTVTFALGTNLNDAQVEVQNRVAQALPRLPEEVQRLGVTTQKSSPDLTMVVHLVSPDHRYDMLYLSNYARLHVQDVLRRLDGVGDVQIFGAGEYSMRVWLNPQKLAQRGLTTGAVAKAIREQNVQVAAGKLNAPPGLDDSAFQLNINTRGRLSSVDDFRDIIVRTDADGGVVHLRDVARVELGSDQYALRSLLNSQEAVAVPIFARPGSNAIQISDEVRATMAQLKQEFPQGVDYRIVYDPTVFVRDSIKAVAHTLLEAIALGQSPKEATRQAMREVTGPIVATALVLCAVFIPTAFISGLTGEFYRQFALTIAISTVISAFNSLTLSPALSAILLLPHDAPRDRLTRGIERAFGWLFRPFNRLFHRGAERYVGSVKRMQGKGAAALVVYAALIALTAFGFWHVPTGFVPTQDKQYLVAFAQLPDAASLDRTEDVIKRMSAIALKQPGVLNAVAFPGLSINGFTNASNSGIVFVTLKPFDERRSADVSAGAIAGALNQKFASIQDAYIAVFPPPPVMGLGTIGGFRMQVEDRGQLGFDELYQQTQKLIAAGRKDPALAGLFSSFQVSVPQVDVDVNREKAKAEGDRKSTRLNSSHHSISYAVFCLKKKKKKNNKTERQERKEAWENDI